MTITKSLTGKELSAINSLCKRIFCILQLKSRPGGWLKQFVCDTVLSYKKVTCAPVLDTSLYPTHHDDF
jgi:hypothetical protein